VISVKVGGGSLDGELSGQGNMRVYVLNGPGKIGEGTTYAASE